MINVNNPLVQPGRFTKQQIDDYYGIADIPVLRKISEKTEHEWDTFARQYEPSAQDVLRSKYGSEPFLTQVNDVSIKPISFAEKLCGYHPERLNKQPNKLGDIPRKAFTYGADTFDEYGRPSGHAGAIILKPDGRTMTYYEPHKSDIGPSMEAFRYDLKPGIQIYTGRTFVRDPAPGLQGKEGVCAIISKLRTYYPDLSNSEFEDLYRSARQSSGLNNFIINEKAKMRQNPLADTRMNRYLNKKYPDLLVEEQQKLHDDPSNIEGAYATRRSYQTDPRQLNRVYDDLIAIAKFETLMTLGHESGYSRNTSLVEGKPSVLPGTPLTPEQRELSRLSGFKKGGIVKAKEAYESNPTDKDLVHSTPTMKIYKEDGDYVVAIRGTNDYRDVKADLAIPFNNLKNTQRYKEDRRILSEFQKTHPGNYTGVGHSLGGAILDELIDEGLIKSGTSYNPATEPKYFNDTRNHRVYKENDPLAILSRPFVKQEIRPSKDIFKAHSLENFPTKKEMRHQITAVPLVEKGKKMLHKVKETAEHAGKAVLKEAKKQSHRLKDVGAVLGAAAGTALTESPIGTMVGKHVGEIAGEKLHEKIQSLKKGGKVAALMQITDVKPAQAKKSRAKKVEVVEPTEMKPVKKPRVKKMEEVESPKPRVKKAVKAESAPVKKPSAWMAHVKAHQAKHGGSYKDAMKNAKATYKR